MNTAVKISYCNLKWKPNGLRMCSNIELTEGMTALQLKNLIRNKLETSRKEISLEIKIFSHKSELDEAYVLQPSKGERYNCKIYKAQ